MLFLNAIHIVRLARCVGIAAVAVSLFGCDSRLPYKTLCNVDSMDAEQVAKSCKIGERILFTPPSWGNEQAPVVFAALHCNPEYAIALTHGAVSCVYQGVETRKPPE